MLLQNKNAVLFAAGGSVGGAIARSLAKAGAKVFLSNHHIEPVQKLADEIIAGGGKAEVNPVDALNETEVNDYINEVVKKAGSIDVSMNLIKTEDIQGIALVDLPFEDFIRPIRRVSESHFITGTACRKSNDQARCRRHSFTDCYTGRDWISYRRWLWTCLLCHRENIAWPCFRTWSVWR
jgi:NAD(P)-dependent dehydrogenase (short-subunit alcohol dehydrogenase family)